MNTYNLKTNGFKGKYVELSFAVTRESDKALCFLFDHREVWLPKSQLRYVECRHGIFYGEIWCPQWLITQNNLWDHFRSVVAV